MSDKTSPATEQPARVETIAGISYPTTGTGTLMITVCPDCKRPKPNPWVISHNPCQCQAGKPEVPDAPNH